MRTRVVTRLCNCQSVPYYSITGVLSLFTTGSNFNADVAVIAGGVVGIVSGAFALVFVVVVAAFWREKRITRRGWCMCMLCTCNCRSYYFVMWACWIHAQASLVSYSW